MKKKRSSAILVIIFFTGVSLLLYPAVSDYWNSFYQLKAIQGYADKVTDLSENDYKEIWEKAIQYNKKLLLKNNRYSFSKQEQKEYEEVLDLTGTGIMAYIEIPKIKVTSPIYHGVEDEVLQIAIGHIPGTSLPIGGESSHSVVSGHRGLPSAKLFTDIDQLEVGDTFRFHVLDEVLTYEVDLISIVLPNDIDTLEIQGGKDICTLVTCTPYGVNSHRLLVRGHRVENEKEAPEIRVPSDALQVDPLMVAPLVAAPMLFLFVIWVQIDYYRNKYFRDDEESEEE